jgi:hypothetical protein
MVPASVRGQDVDKPKLVTDYNSGMGGVDLSDVYLTCNRSPRKSLKTYYQPHFNHLIDICGRNSYLLKKMVAAFARWNFK